MCRFRNVLAAFVFAMATMAALSTEAMAQLPTYGVGRPPTPQEIEAWDLTIPADGRGLTSRYLRAALEGAARHAAARG